VSNTGPPCAQVRHVHAKVHVYATDVTHQAEHMASVSHRKGCTINIAGGVMLYCIAQLCVGAMCVASTLKIHRESLVRSYSRTAPRQLPVVRVRVHPALLLPRVLSAAVGGSRYATHSPHSGGTHRWIHIYGTHCEHAMTCCCLCD
jgi:hypothetical protein